MKPRPDGRIAKCECGHSQPQHLDGAYNGRTLEGEGECGLKGCRCKRFVYTGWVKP